SHSLLTVLNTNQQKHQRLRPQPNAVTAGPGRNSPNVHEEYKTSAPTAAQQKTYNSTTHQRHGNDGTTARVFDSNIPVELSAVIATLHEDKQDQGTRGPTMPLLIPVRRQ